MENEELINLVKGLRRVAKTMLQTADLIERDGMLADDIFKYGLALQEFAAGIIQAAGYVAREEDEIAGLNDE